VVIATWLGAGQSGVPVSAGDFSSFTKMTMPALSPTHPSFRWIFFGAKADVASS
jgi:hypothetical protein